MANPQGAINDRLRSLLGASEPTEAKAEVPADAKTDEVETPKSDTEAKSRRVKAKLNDRDIEFDVITDDVDLDLIPKGLMMESDYRKKTSEVAERRKALDAKEQEVASQLSELESMLYGEDKHLNSDEMISLRESDPEEYYRKRNDLESKKEQAKKIKDKLSKDLSARQKELIAAERAKWRQVVPEWLDDSKLESDIKKMSKTMMDVGFEAQDVESVYDSRLIQLIRKAALFDEISSKPIESKRSKTPPKSSKPGGGEAQPAKTNSARDRLRKSGRRSDAEGAIKELLGL